MINTLRALIKEKKKKTACKMGQVSREVETLGKKSKENAKNEKHSQRNEECL